MKSRFRLHIFNFISIYSDKYMKTVDSEYWLGYNRKKILTIGKYTVWIRWRK